MTVLQRKESVGVCRFTHVARRKADRQCDRPELHPRVLEEWTKFVDKALAISLNHFS